MAATTENKEVTVVDVDDKEIEKELDRFSCPCGSTVSKKNKSSHLKSKKHLDYQTSTTGLDPKLATMIFRMSQKIDEIADAVSILLGDMDSDIDEIEEGEEEEEPKEKPKLVRQNAIEEKKEVKENKA